MERKDMIPAKDFCLHHSISYTFISGLQEAGLVDVDTVNEEHYLFAEQLSHIEPLVRMHTELDINMEGIEAIAHLLQRVSEMQQRMHALQERLKLYEDE